MKSVLISIHPKWVEKIANGQKTIEVRKTAPKCEVPFKCYIYETKGKKIECGFHIEDTGITLREKYVFGMHKARIVKHYRNEGRGKVIGEFVCDKVFLLHPYTYDKGSADLERRKFIQTFEGSSKENEILAATCLTQDEMFDYIGADNYGYGWHISDLKIYNKPKELSEFKTPPCKKSEKACGNCKWLVKRNTPNVYECECYVEDGRPITRPSQSWQYVEEL